MAKKSVIEREKKRRRIVARYADTRKELKAMSVDMNLSYDERMNARKKLQALPRNASKTRLVNRCQLTGRAKGVHKKFMLSRITLREYANQGLLPGVTKSSW